MVVEMDIGEKIIEKINIMKSAGIEPKYIYLGRSEYSELIESAAVVFSRLNGPYCFYGYKIIRLITRDHIAIGF